MNKSIETFEEFLELLPNDGEWFLDKNRQLRHQLRGIKTCPICFAAGIPGTVFAISAGLDLGMPRELISGIMIAADSGGSHYADYRRKMLEQVGLA